MIHVGDCREVMRTLAPNSVDSIVTDPPYGLEFMGKEWDTFGDVRRANRGVIHNMVNANGKPKFSRSQPAFDLTERGRGAFQAFNEEWAREALHVLKPGGHMLAFSGSRTYHRMVCAIEDAGFEVRDQIMWLYGQGFPKSLNVAMEYEQRLCEYRDKKWFYRDTAEPMQREPPFRDPDANEWAGFHTALKPSHEPIVLARKPLSESTVAGNVLRWGTGAINVDGCRVAADWANDPSKRGLGYGYTKKGDNTDGMFAPGPRTEYDTTKGRWPANLILDGSDEVVSAFPETGVSQGGSRGAGGQNGKFSPIGAQPDFKPGFGDSGSAARFFYCAKASKKDRDAGLEGMAEHRVGVMQDDAYKWQVNGKGNKINLDTRRANTHPTVKPTSLMRYLCRMATPPGGLVLDPFMGSGSTGRGAVLEGFSFIGIEMSEEYAAIARPRIADAEREARESAKMPSIAQLVDLARDIHALGDGADLTLTVRKPRPPASSGQIEIDV